MKVGYRRLCYRAYDNPAFIWNSDFGVPDEQDGCVCLGVGVRLFLRIYRKKTDPHPETFQIPSETFQNSFDTAEGGRGRRAPKARAEGVSRRHAPKGARRRRAPKACAERARRRRAPNARAFGAR